MRDEVMLENLYQELINNIKSYHPMADDMGKIREAFETAKEAHSGQRRKSGEPFVIHPICVAIILAELKLDKESIIAALLHDVVEDTEWTSEDIRRKFGDEVMFLVEGVTKLTSVSADISKAEMKLESFRKLILATAQDVRVIIIKLADRLHNMRTLKYQSEKKQKEIAQETLDLYSPIAQKLGISFLSTQLEDLAFSYLYTEEYFALQNKIAEMHPKEKMLPLLTEIKNHLTDQQVSFKVKYEVKHFFSIYRKMVKRQEELEDMYDVGAVKIIVDSVRECYIALGIMHHLYNPVPDRFKDYTAIPKDNMYQSIHTTLISKTGQKFEVQIKTKEMEEIGEYGVLANWKYGEASVDIGSISKSQREKSIWLAQILEWQQDIKDNSEFIDLVKCDFDLFTEQISCFTPKGDAIRLQKGATAVDFAYAIHSDIGNRMTGVRVNEKRKELDYVLQNGDLVEILAGDVVMPRLEWLQFVKTSNAKNKIKKFYRK